MSGKPCASFGAETLLQAGLPTKRYRVRVSGSCRCEEGCWQSEGGGVIGERARIVANQPFLDHCGRIDRFRKYPSVPLSTYSPAVPCASGPRFRSRTISAGRTAVLGMHRPASTLIVVG